jgi:quinol-cytochrome oxidoreductase complex cytochrome b subunit
MAWLSAAAAAEFALLAVTGVYLVFFYRPAASVGWFGTSAHVQPAIRFEEFVRLLHRLASLLMILTALAIAGVGLAMAVARSLRRRGQAMTTTAAVGVALATLCASFTGFLLPWDQLALRAVTVGTSMMGFRAAWSTQVQYVLIGGAEISPDTLRLWFLVHVLALPAVLVALGLLAVRRILRPERAGRPGGTGGTGGTGRPENERGRHTGLGS